MKSKSHCPNLDGLSGIRPRAQASARFYDLTHFSYLMSSSHRIALCVLYPFLQLPLYLMFQCVCVYSGLTSLSTIFQSYHDGYVSGKRVRKNCLCVFLAGNRTPDFLAKSTFLLILSFSRYCNRSFLTIMAGVGVAHKLLKKIQEKITIQIFDKLNY